MAQPTLPLGVAAGRVDTDDSDTQCTPRWLADLLPEVDLDPCSNARSHIRARRSCVLPDDGLLVDWSKHSTIWINPPYSDPLPWARHALTAQGSSQLWLVKLAPDTRWWATLVDDLGAGVHLFRRRLAFEKNGAARDNSNMLSALLHWDAGHGVFDDAIAAMRKGGWLW